jgi:hypothetical protein
MDMTSLLMGLAGKDHAGIHPAERVNLWRQRSHVRSLLKVFACNVAQ